MRALAFALLGFVPFTGCICGEPLIVDDIFLSPEEPVAPGTLHTYASNARVTFKVRSASAALDIADVDVAVDGAVTVDEDNPSERSGDVLTLNVRTQEAGAGTLLFSRDGEALSERASAVVDADDISLAVTAPEDPGLELPAIDPSSIRIQSGFKAAFRATLTKDGEEIFGLDALTVTTSDTELTSRNGIGCAAAGCDQVRLAIELNVPATVAANVDVTLATGDATLAVTVVPTAADEITDLVADQRDTTDLEDGDLTGVIAHVLAGDEPVFGAPVVWAIDDVVVVDGEGTIVNGDALQLEFSQNDRATIEATLGDQTFAVDVESLGEGAAVASITAACGAGAGAPLLIALLALAARRRRARRS